MDGLYNLRLTRKAYHAEHVRDAWRAAIAGEGEKTAWEIQNGFDDLSSAFQNILAFSSLKDAVTNSEDFKIVEQFVVRLCDKTCHLETIRHN